ncbi:helix-turn-helix domain-containing protein [Streptomyces sp. NPDC000888]
MPSCLPTSPAHSSTRSVSRARPTSPNADTGGPHLSERECEVFAALASGWSGREIAERLSIAPTTVKSHISSILTKIGARARVQAVVFAYETLSGQADKAAAPPERHGLLGSVKVRDPVRPAGR